MVRYRRFGVGGDFALPTPRSRYDRVYFSGAIRRKALLEFLRVTRW